MKLFVLTSMIAFVAAPWMSLAQNRTLFTKSEITLAKVSDFSSRLYFATTDSVYQSTIDLASCSPIIGLPQIYDQQVREIQELDENLIMVSTINGSVTKTYPYYNYKPLDSSYVINVRDKKIIKRFPSYLLYTHSTKNKSIYVIEQAIYQLDSKLFIREKFLMKDSAQNNIRIEDSCQRVTHLSILDDLDVLVVGKSWGLIEGENTCSVDFYSSINLSKLGSVNFRDKYMMPRNIQRKKDYLYFEAQPTISGDEFEAHLIDLTTFEEVDLALGKPFFEHITSEGYTRVDKDENRIVNMYMEYLNAFTAASVFCRACARCLDDWGKMTGLEGLEYPFPLQGPSKGRTLN